MGELDLTDDRPPYQQVASRLRETIQRGYKPGDRLPAHQEVATTYGVSVGTVKRAFAVLQRERVIVTRQGQGSFVVRVPEVEEQSSVEVDVLALRQEVGKLAKRVTAIEAQLRRGSATR